MEAINIFTLIPLFAFPTERNLLFTCNKYRKNARFSRNQV